MLAAHNFTFHSTMDPYHRKEYDIDPCISLLNKAICVLISQRNVDLSRCAVDGKVRVCLCYSFRLRNLAAHVLST